MAEGMKALASKRMTKSYKFMGEDVKIAKLTVSQVMEIQEKAKDIEKDDTQGFNVLRKVIQYSVEGANDLTDDDFNNFPLDELSKLSNEIMRFSGIGADTGK